MKNHAHNLKGRRFGSLLVLDRNKEFKSIHSMWDCYCEDCGEIYTIRGASLVSGNTTTCKCHKYKHNIFETIPNGTSKMYDSKGNFTLIDTEDIDRISKYYWFKDSNNRMKYWRNTKGEYLHKFIIQCPKDFVIDHKEGNLDDHRKSQLRCCTKGQNARNIRVKSRNLPIGVCYDEIGQRYVAYIRVNGKQIRAYFKEPTPDNAIKQRKAWEELYYSDGFKPKYKLACRR